MLRSGVISGPPKLCAGALLTLEFVVRGSLPRSTPNVHNPNDVGAFIDREEHAINMRTAAVVKDTNRMIRVEAFGRHAASSRELIE